MQRSLIICYNINMKKEQIIKLLQQKKQTLAKEYGIKSLGLFGSYSKGKQNKNSDIDILIEFNKSISLLQYLKLSNALSEKTGKKIDLVMKSALKKNIGKEILKEVIYI